MYYFIYRINLINSVGVLALIFSTLTVLNHRYSREQQPPVQHKKVFDVD